MANLQSSTLKSLLYSLDRPRKPKIKFKVFVVFLTTASLSDNFLIILLRVSIIVRKFRKPYLSVLLITLGCKSYVNTTTVYVLAKTTNNRSRPSIVMHYLLS